MTDITYMARIWRIFTRPIMETVGNDNQAILQEKA